MATLPPLAQVAGANLALFEAIFNQADTNHRGIIGAIDAANYLKKSGLNEKVLSQIWDLSDPGGKGFLDKVGFCTALKLISLAQNGKEVSVANTALHMPPPNMGPGMPVVAAEGPWTVPAAEKTKYDQIFDGLQPVNGLLSGDKVRPVLLNSKLPVDVLGRVWDLSDIDKDGFLDRDEFAVAMHLVYKALEKEPVPMSLPPQLIPPSKRGGSSGGVVVRKRLPSGSSIPGAVSVLPPQVGAGMPMGAGRDSPPTLGGAAGVGTYPGTGASWVVTSLEKTQYDDMFVQADLDMDGFVNGMEIKDIFLQSGVPQPVLAHIWNLCDTKQLGKLNSEQFALAMYLVNLKIKGVEPPQSLTPEMVPPSMRAAPSLDGAAGGEVDHSSLGMKELDMIQKEIDDFKREKMKLETEKAQKDADIKIKNGEVQALQKELDGINMTVKQLETQKGEAQKRLDDLDDKKMKLEHGLQEFKEKFEEEQKTIIRLKDQIESSESASKNQEEELKRIRDELNTFRQTEVELEQAIDLQKGQLDTLSKNITDSKTKHGQTQISITRLQEGEPKILEAINQYNALISGDPDAREPEDGTSKAAAGFGGLADDPFKAKDPFSGTNGDPFQSADPFHNASNDDPFKGQRKGSDDPFQGEDLGGGAASSDPFGADPFESAFSAVQSQTQKPSSLQAPPSYGAPQVKNDPFGSGDDFFTKASVAKNDPFDPFGGSGISDLKSPVNPEDPFGTGTFDISSAKGKSSSLRPRSKSPAPLRPKSPSRARSKSPARPSLPPKQKKAPAPPRPAPPRPGKSPTPRSKDPFGAPDPFGGGTDAFGADFANFSPSKFPSAPSAPSAPNPDVDQLEWATRSSQKEWERQKQLEEQEKADFEYALALSRGETGSSNA